MKHSLFTLILIMSTAGYASSSNPVYEAAHKHWQEMQQEPEHDMTVVLQRESKDVEAFLNAHPDITIFTCVKCGDENITLYKALSKQHFLELRSKYLAKNSSDTNKSVIS